MSEVYETLTLFGRDFHFHWKLPGTWNELDAWQLRRIVSLQQSVVDRYSFRALAVPTLLKVPKSLLKQWVLSRRINVEYCELASFLLDPTERLTRNVIGHYRRHRTINRWQQMVGRQYWIAEVYFAEYTKNRDPLMLDKMMCAFYAPIKADFAKVEADEYYHHFSRWPMDVKLSVLTFWAGAREEIHETFPDIFKRGGKKGGNYGKGILRLRSELASNDLTKGHEVDARPLPEILFQLDKNIADANKRTK